MKKLLSLYSLLLLVTAATQAAETAHERASASDLVSTIQCQAGLATEFAAGDLMPSPGNGMLAHS